MTNSTIDDIEAIKQILNFYALYIVIEPGKITDGDIEGKLINKVCFKCEVKKKTDNHTVEKIISSNQWDVFRSIARDEVYLIYATHNEAISDKPIDTSTLNVEYVEQYGKEVELKKAYTLLEYLNGLSSIGRYYITVKYPEAEKPEFALLSPREDGKWSSDKYWAKLSSFETEDECLTYIKKRYEKEFNQSYIYSIFYVESMSSVKLVHRYTYPETIGL